MIESVHFIDVKYIIKSLSVNNHGSYIHSNVNGVCNSNILRVIHARVTAIHTFFTNIYTKKPGGPGLKKNQPKKGHTRPSNSKRLRIC